MIISLALIGGAIYYLSKRFSVFFPNLSIRVWLWVLGSITVCMIAAAFFLSDAGLIGTTISIIGSFWMVMLFYVVLSVAIPIEGLTKEIRAVHVTDIHLGNFRGEKYLGKVVDEIMSLNPDVVFNTGDMFDSKIHFKRNIDILKPLHKLTVPHYFVYGNHDEYEGVEEVVKRMKDAGAIALQNEISSFGELRIIGLNNMAKDSTSFDMHTLPGSETVESVMKELAIEETT